MAAGPSRFVDGLVLLDSRETKARLAEVMTAVRARADHLGGAHGQALLDRLARVEADLRSAARKGITDLAAVLVDYENPPPASAFADIVADLDRPPEEVQPTPAPPKGRPTLPVRMPPRVPARSS